MPWQQQPKTTFFQFKGLSQANKATELEII